MRLALAALSLAVLGAGEAFCQTPGPSLEITARVVLEDGAAIRSAPMISLLVPGGEYPSSRPATGPDALHRDERLKSIAGLLIFPLSD